MGRPRSVPKTTGPAAAAVLAAGLGLFALALSQLLSEVSDPWKQTMQQLGNAWMPGAPGIGPYSGKETVALIVWLGSWALLHVLLKKRDVNLIASGIIALMLIGLATTLLWPPVIELLTHYG